MKRLNLNLKPTLQSLENNYQQLAGPWKINNMQINKRFYDWNLASPETFV